MIKAEPVTVLDEAALDQRFVQAPPVVRACRRWLAYAPTRDRNGALCVADGNGQGVSGVIGMRNGRQAQNQPDHLLNLGFVGFPIAHHGLFDLRRGVFRNRDISLRRGQQDRSSGLSNRHGRRHVLSEKSDSTATASGRWRSINSPTAE